MRRIFRAAMWMALLVGTGFAAGNVWLAVQSRQIGRLGFVFSLAWFVLALTLRTFGALIGRIERLEKRLDELTRRRPVGHGQAQGLPAPRPDLSHERGGPAG